MSYFFLFVSYLIQQYIDSLLQFLSKVLSHFKGFRLFSFLLKPSNSINYFKEFVALEFNLNPKSEAIKLANFIDFKARRFPNLIDFKNPLIITKFVKQGIQLGL